MNRTTKTAAVVLLVCALVASGAVPANAARYLSGVRTCPGNVRGYVQVWKNWGTLRVYAPGDNSTWGVLHTASYLKVNGAFGGGVWGVDGSGAAQGSPQGDIYKIVTGCNKSL